MHLGELRVESSEQKSMPMIIAIEYYDGATEGFAWSLKGMGACYFKLIAWDEEQDERLYAVTGIDSSLLDNLYRLLSNDDNQSITKIWIPIWSFRSKRDEIEANGLIEFCKNQLKSSWVLMYGKQIESESIKKVLIKDYSEIDIKNILQNEQLDSLNKWLEKIKNDGKSTS